MERLRILVVDDELALANLIEKYLRRMGFDVEPVSDSRLALERFRAAEVPFHLVLADFTMPQLSGEELLRTILRSDPNVRAILCSGYAAVHDRSVDGLWARSHGKCSSHGCTGSCNRMRQARFRRATRG